MSNHQNDILAEQEWELQQEIDRQYDCAQDSQEFESLLSEAEWPSQEEIDR